MDQLAHQIENQTRQAQETEQRHRPDRMTNPAGEAGWYLSQERLRRNIGLEAASQQTGIHPSHIFAIEHGDMTRMPPRVEALEMIAAYANYLGFDPEPLLKHYVTFLPAPQLAPRRHPADPAPLSSAKVLPFGKYIPKIPSLDLKNFKLPSAAQFPGGQNGVIASLAAAFMLFAGSVWYMSAPGEVREPVDMTAEVQAPPIVDAPAESQQVAAEVADPMPTATTGTEAAEITVQESPLVQQSTAALENPALSADTPAVTDSEDLGAFIQKTLAADQAPVQAPATQTAAIPAPAIEPVAQQPATPEQTASTAPIATDGGIYGSEDPNARLVIKATDNVWVRIEDSHGQVLMTQGLKKGDIYRVPDQPGLTIIAKDGGLLTYIIDGQDKGPLGKPGEILANEALDPAKLASRG
jgi:cytoskeleton protein RodZ